MYDLYNDMSPLQVWLKPPQIGATECQTIKCLYCAKKNGWDIIYTLPTANDIHDMAGGKVNRIIAQNDILRSWVKDHDTVEQKSVGQNIIYYRGTYTQKSAMMVASNLNVHDEVDASDPSVIAQYETRLQARADGRRWYFSHPSVAGHGVDIYWQQSDKKEWYVTCPECKGEQQLKWPDNVDQVNKRYICALCKTGMADDTRRYGKWKPTAEGIFSGYHISQLMCAWISADKILHDKEHKDEQYFYNYVLGLPYVGSENKIEAEVVLKNVIGITNSQEDRIIIGVDTGLPIHYTLQNSQGVFFYGTCKDYDTLEKLLNRFPNSILVSDQGGDLIGIRALQAKYIGRVYLCFYRKDRKTNMMIKWGEGEEHGTVQVDRNRMIQLIVEQMRDPGRIRLNGTVDEWREFASHFGNIYRELVVAKNNVGKDDHTLYAAEYVWKRNGPDHFVHALLYGLVGMDKYAKQSATIVQADPLQGIPVARIFDSSNNLF